MLWTLLLIKTRSNLDFFFSLYLGISFIIAGTMIYHGIILNDVDRLVFSGRMNPNVQAYILAFSVPLIFYKLDNTTHDTTFKTFTYYLLFLSILIAAIATGSRGGFLVAIFLSLWGLLPRFFFHKNLTKLLRNTAFTIITTAGIFFIITTISFLEQPLQRIASLKDAASGTGIEQMDTMQSRLPSQRAAIEAWKQKPLLGVGYGEFMYHTHYYSINSHNTYLEVLAELGTLGLIIYLYLIFSLTKNMYRLFGYHGLGIGCFFIISSFGSNIFLSFHMLYVMSVLSVISFPAQDGSP